MHCFSVPLGATRQELLLNESSDDLGPEGCVLARLASYLSNSLDKDMGEQDVDVWCGAGMCGVWLQFEGHEISMGVHMRQLQSAVDLADSVHLQFSSYIVK